MKSIIISDIHSNFESIIPYALHFSKHFWDRATLIHPVDPRKQQAVSSAYADSQTFEVGRKLTHDEILERETHRTRLELNHLLSHEASRLNFPMRVDVRVEDTSLDAMLSKEAAGIPDALIMVSSKPDGHVLEQFSEFLDVAGHYKNLVLVIPPGLTYSPPRKTFVLYDYSSFAYHSVMPVMELLHPLNPSVNVADVDSEGNYLELELQSEAWREVVKKLIEPGVSLSTSILSGKDHAQTIAGFVQRNNYSLAALPGCAGNTGNNKKYTARTILRLIANTGIPVLLYPC